MRKGLMVFFVAVIACMLWVTITASLDRGVFEASAELWQHLWFRATLADAYFGFLTVYLWVLYRERGWLARAVWFALFMTLGNFAIAAYALMQLWSLGPEESLDGLFSRKHEI